MHELGKQKNTTWQALETRPLKWQLHNYDSANAELPWFNFTRPPYVPKLKNGISRNIPEYSKNPEYSIFAASGMSPIFFGIFQIVSYPRFLDNCMSQIENGLQYSKFSLYSCPKIDLEYSMKVKYSRI